MSKKYKLKENEVKKRKRLFWKGVKIVGIALIIISIISKHSQAKYTKERNEIIETVTLESDKKLEKANEELEKKEKQLEKGKEKVKKKEEIQNNFEQKERVRFALKEEESAKIFKEFSRISKDVVAYLDIPSIAAKEPVCKTNDNNYYLRKNLTGQYYENGTAFIEQNNIPDFSDDNTVIYHHNMKEDGVDFSNLDQFLKEEFAKEHKYINIYYNGKLNVYKIFSCYKAEPDLDYRSLQFYNTFDKLDYLENLFNRSEVSLEKPKFNENTRIVTLSTCADEGLRTVLHAVLVEDDRRFQTIYEYGDLK